MRPLQLLSACSIGKSFSGALPAVPPHAAQAEKSCRGAACKEAACKFNPGKIANGSRLCQRT
jgi:hypothetical protein